MSGLAGNYFCSHGKCRYRCDECKHIKLPKGRAPGSGTINKAPPPDIDVEVLPTSRPVTCLASLRPAEHLTKMLCRALWNPRPAASRAKIEQWVPKQGEWDGGREARRGGVEGKGSVWRRSAAPGRRVTHRALTMQRHAGGAAPGRRYASSQGLLLGARVCAESAQGPGNRLAPSWPTVAPSWPPVVSRALPAVFTLVGMSLSPVGLSSTGGWCLCRVARTLLVDMSAFDARDARRWTS